MGDISKEVAKTCMLDYTFLYLLYTVHVGTYIYCLHAPRIDSNPTWDQNAWTSKGDEFSI
jgi:hypothetical protein